MSFLEKYTEQSYAFMRILAALLFMFHGAQKILGFMPKYPPPEIGSQLWIGGMIELIAGLMIAIGFRTRWAAFISSGTMAVAYLQFHWALKTGPEFFPANNGGDAAILYALIFLFVACRGAGIWSLDNRNA